MCLLTIKKSYLKCLDSGDETLRLPDGTVKLPDGSIRLRDGTGQTPNRYVHLPDHRILYPDESISFPQGTLELAFGDRAGSSQTRPFGDTGISFDQSRRPENSDDSQSLDMSIPGKVRFSAGRQSRDGLIRFTDGRVLSSQSAAGEPVLLKLLDAIRTENKKISYLTEVFDNLRRRFAQLEAKKAAANQSPRKSSGYEEFGPVFGPGGKLASICWKNRINDHSSVDSFTTQSALANFQRFFKSNISRTFLPNHRIAQI